MDFILKYLGNTFNQYLSYENIKIKRPNELYINSIVQDNKLYVYGILPQNYDTNKKNLNEKIYSLNFENNDSITIYFSKEINYNKNTTKDIIIIDEKTNIFKFSDISKKTILYYRYKNIDITLLKSKTLKLYNIYIGQSRIVILVGNTKDKVKVNRVLLKLLESLNQMSI